MLDVSYYPADLTLDPDDFDGPATPLVSLDELSLASDGTFKVDLGATLDRFPGLAIGFRVKLSEDPDLNSFGSLGTPFTAWIEVISGIPFLRGDSSDDGKVDLSDPLSLIAFLFLGTGDAVRCEDAADVDQNGRLDLSDAVATIGYLFLGGPGPAAPFPLCGRVPTGDRLSCSAYSSCGAARP